MAEIIRETAIYFLREGQWEDHMRDRLPAKPDNVLIKLCEVLRLGKLFYRFVIYLSFESRYKIFNKLVNTFRIPWILVPPEELQKKYQEAFGFLILEKGRESLGDYLEFGVYQGSSLLCAHNALCELNLKNVRLFGFDSFEGLPSPEGSDDAYDKLKWSEGEFHADYQFTKKRLTDGGVKWDRTFLIKGFFSSTLNKELIAEHNIKKASVIMIDCDMYSSTKEALDFCAPLIDDAAVILFDDWNCTGDDGGEKRAFKEFLDDNPSIKAEDFGTYSSNSKCFKLSR